MRTDRSALARLAACGVVLFLTGCPGKLANKQSFLAAAAVEDAGDADMSACGDVVTRIFLPSCGDNGCHGATGPQQGLDLVSPGIEARVVGVQAKVCPGTLADPDNPAGSLLYTKLLSKPQCGTQMPLARPALSSADAECVLEWIAAQ